MAWRAEPPSPPVSLDKIKESSYTLEHLFDSTIDWLINRELVRVESILILIPMHSQMANIKWQILKWQFSTNEEHESKLFAIAWKHYLSIGYEAGSVQGQSWSFDLDRPWSVAKATRKRIDDHWVPRFWDPLSLIILVDGICFINSISIRVDCVVFLVHFRAFEAIVKLLSAPISPTHCK